MRQLRFRLTVRFLMILVAIVGVLLGGWIMRSRAKDYAKRSQQYAVEEQRISKLIAYNKSSINIIFEQTRIFKKYLDQMSNYRDEDDEEIITYTKSALISEERFLATARETLEENEKLAAHFGALKDKYRLAAARPWFAVSADPPVPIVKARFSFWLARHDYKMALAAVEQSIRRNPEHADHYNNQAWIWATCPEPKYRDGKRAVKSATRACELSAWKDFWNLDTLASAYAEVGDFEAAVRWQQKALARTPPDSPALQKVKDRLMLYRQGKSYRGEK